MVFHTLSGDLIVKQSDYGYTMDFPIGKSKPVLLTPAMASAANGIAREAFFDGGDLVLLVESEEALKAFEPDAEKIRPLEGLGMILTAPSRDYDFVSRCFYPKRNVLEDPVTGRAHTYLAPIWAAKLGKSIMHARQLSRRGGNLTVELQPSRVLISGNVQLFMSGDIPVEY